MPEHSLQVPPFRLISFDGFEKTFEVPRTKSTKVIPLNNLDENRWSIHQGL
jgi:hypothetical protein